MADGRRFPNDESLELSLGTAVAYAILAGIQLDFCTAWMRVPQPPRACQEEWRQGWTPEPTYLVIVSCRWSAGRNHRVS